jgi:hypothetical protein
MILVKHERSWEQHDSVLLSYPLRPMSSLWRCAGSTPIGDLGPACAIVVGAQGRGGVYDIPSPYQKSHDHRVWIL